VPREIGRLAKLEVLNLHRNMLSGQLPSSVGDLRSLRSADISGNLISGTLPKVRGKYTNE